MNYKKEKKFSNEFVIIMNITLPCSFRPYKIPPSLLFCLALFCLLWRLYDEHLTHSSLSNWLFYDTFGHKEVWEEIINERVINIFNIICSLAWRPEEIIGHETDIVAKQTANTHSFLICFKSVTPQPTPITYNLVAFTVSLLEPPIVFFLVLCLVLVLILLEASNRAGAKQAAAARRRRQQTGPNLV